MAEEKIDVLVIGSGGREHTLAWKIASSPRVGKLYAAPGNPGTARVAKNVEIAADDIDELVRFAKRERIGLTIVGPEAPLVAGIADRFGEEDLRLFGPSRKAAALEGSKVFAKTLMRKHGIPTGDFQVFSDFDKAAAHVQGIDGPLVIKADGLAAGKGVFVCDGAEDACDALRQVMVDRSFGDSGDRAVVEERLTGEEASILAFTDGRTIVPLASSQDHKPVYDEDKGPNTGGMGAYSPAPVVTDEVMDRIVREILVPTVHAMNKEGCRYAGLLYAGLMISAGEPKVLEFNVRFGDPEAQPVLMRMKSDLLPVLEAVVESRLDRIEDIEWDERAAVCVVMASGGYPGKYEKEKAIEGIEKAESAEDVVVFQAGTSMKDETLVTSGGRVLGVTALGDGIGCAIENTYAAVEKVSFDKAYWRKDIGAKALRSRG